MTVQSPPTQLVTEQKSKAPEWQTAAGGKMAFEVASVRRDPSGRFIPPPFSMDSDDNYIPTGGLFTTDTSLQTYISFAYKLDLLDPGLSHLPEWVITEHYEIRARATGNPTKDQMRLMMQSLLAERFKLAIHFETRERPVLALTLIKPKTPGLKLRLHADGPACDSHEPPSPNSAANIDVFPPICNEYMAIDKPDHKILTGARNTTVELMAAFFSNIGQLGRPVVDHTGLNGPIDFTMEYTPDSNAASGTSAPPDLKGETFLEAVKEQLGLKLEPTKARLDIPVVDHVERPSEN